MSIINLTPHVINVNSLAISPSGTVARVTSATKVVGVIDGIDIVETSFGEVQGLPEKVEGTFLLVSALVRLAVKNRSDLLSPGEQIRDSEGKVVGCKNLTR